MFHDKTGAPSRTLEVAAFLASRREDLRRRALQLTRDRDRAEDLLQDTAERALARARLYTLGTRVDAWVYRILANLWRDRARQWRRREWTSDDLDRLPAPQGDEPDHLALWSRHEEADVRRALSDVPSIFREPFELFSFAGLRYADIGRRLGLPRATVGTRISRARALLKSLLSGAATSVSTTRVAVMPSRSEESLGRDLRRRARGRRGRAHPSFEPGVLGPEPDPARRREQLGQATRA